MKINIINRQMLNTRIPNDNEEYINNLSYEKQIEYFKMYEIYTLLLVDYLGNNCDLFEGDNYLNASELNYKKVDEKEMDFYQYMCKDKLHYFYIRNNIHIENLNLEEQQFLKDCENETKSEEEIKMFVSKTLSDVIAQDKNTQLSFAYGPNLPNYIVQNNVLVLGYRYNKFNIDSNQSEEDFENKGNEKEQELENVILALKIRMESNLNVPIAFINYNEFSIKDKDESIEKSSEESEEIKR